MTRPCGVWQSECVTRAARIVLLRHGQTDFNVEGRLQGSSDLPLNKLGRVQGGRVGAVLTRRFGGEGESVGVWADGTGSGGVRIVCSPLARARETAGLIAHQMAAHGMLRGEEVGDGGTSVIVDDRLIEGAFGAFEGLTIEEIRERFPAEFALWRAGDVVPGVGIEPAREVGERVAASVLEWADRTPEGEVLLVVSHGSALRRGLLCILGLDPQTFRGLRGLDNCHWSELTPDPKRGAWRLAGHNLGWREDVIGG